MSISIPSENANCRYMKTESVPSDLIKTVTKIDPVWIQGTKWLDVMLPADAAFFANFLPTPIAVVE